MAVPNLEEAETALTFFASPHQTIFLLKSLVNIIVLNACIIMKVDTVRINWKCVSKITLGVSGRSGKKLFSNTL